MIFVYLPKTNEILEFWNSFRKNEYIFIDSKNRMRFLDKIELKELNYVPLM